MKPLLLSCIVLLAIGCKKSHKLTMSDLKFPDYEKEFIAKNGVDRTYQISCDSNSNRIYRQNYNKEFSYDSLGRPIYETEVMVFMGNTITYKYDSLGLISSIRRRSDFSSSWDFMHVFYPDSSLIQKYITSNKRKYLIGKYRFDCNGLLTEYTVEKENYNYYYDDNGRLIKSTFKVIGDSLVKKEYSNDSYAKPIESTCLIYYTNGVIDSTVTHNILYNPLQNYTSKTYYDKRGLKTKTYQNDTLIFTYKHHIRK